MTDVTVQVLKAMIGYGSKKDIITIPETAQVDFLITEGVLALYTAPVPGGGGGGSPGSGAVTSVAGRFGDVTLTSADVTGVATSAALSAEISRAMAAEAALTGGGGGSVTSVNSHTGVVVLAVGDISGAATTTALAAETSRAQAAEAAITAAASGALAPSGSTTSTADTTNIQALIDAANTAGGGSVKVGPGTFWVNNLVWKTGVYIDGVGGPDATIIKLQNSKNVDVITSYQFSTLTLGGTTGGITSCGIRNVTIDGNKANNSGTGIGIRVYGYQFVLENVIIRNCIGLGLYTEWTQGGIPSPNGQMEAFYHHIRIHDNAGGGWLNRGPHDSQFNKVIISNNVGGIGLQTQCPTGMGVAAGSNAVNVSTFTGTQTLNVGLTVGYPTAGTLAVATSAGTAIITYTGLTATTFTGCHTISGSGTLTTGGNVNLNGNSFDGGTLVGDDLHVWGMHTVGVQCDNAGILATNAQSEGATVGQVLLRCDHAYWEGWIFSGGVSGNYGLRLGDATYATQYNTIRATFGDPSFAGTSAATASIDFATSHGGNRVEGTIIAPSGTTHITGSVNADDITMLKATGQSGTINTGNGSWQTP